MATLLRSRRFAARALEITQQYVTFPLRQHWFALPIQALQRVSLCKEEDTTPPDATATIQNANNVQLIDIDRKIFLTEKDAQPSLAGVENVQQDSCLILLKSTTDQTFGFKVDGPPVMQRVSQTMISPLTAGTDYPSHLQSICSCVIHNTGAAPIFVFDVEQLCHRLTTL